MRGWRSSKLNFVRFELLSIRTKNQLSEKLSLLCKPQSSTEARRHKVRNGVAVFFDHQVSERLGVPVLHDDVLAMAREKRTPGLISFGISANEERFIMMKP